MLLVWTCAAALLGAAIAFPSTGSSPDTSKDTFKLVLLHTNDMHARFEQTDRNSSKCRANQAEAGQCYGGFARVAHQVREARNKATSGEAPPVLFLNAGDTYQGTVWFTVHKWKIAAAFINLLQPDAISLGNHEFDDGVGGLVPFLNNVTCPVLAANVNTTLEPTLAATPLKKSVVLDVNGVKVGIVGYLTRETKNISQTGRVEITDEVEAIKKEMQQLKNNGVNILIALGHSGYDIDLRIAREVPDVDVVIGGHTNTFLYNGSQPDNDVPDGLYPTIVTQASGRKVPVVQAYAYTKYLGQLTLEFDQNGEAKVYVGNPVLLDNKIPQDADVLQELDKWREAVTRTSKETVGSTKVLLEGSTKVCRTLECNLGNLITDAMVFYHTRNFKAAAGWTEAPIAIQQGGGIRNSIDSSSGEVTMEDLMGVLPFDNSMNVVTLNGSQVLEMLEWSVYEYDPTGVVNLGSFLQFSGLKVVYNISQHAGKRVASAQVLCADCRVPRYSDVQENVNYNLLVPSFLYNGGDGYHMFQEGTVTEHDYSDLDAVADYFRRKSPVYPAVQGRIIFNPPLDEVVIDENSSGEEGNEENSNEENSNEDNSEEENNGNKGSPTTMSVARLTVFLCVLFTLIYK